MICIKCKHVLTRGLDPRELQCSSCGSRFLEIHEAPPKKWEGSAIGFSETGIQCPEDNSQLRLVNIEGLRIEVCPQCYRIWFDKGELEQYRRKFPGKKETPLWKRHQKQQDELENPGGTLEWVLWCVERAINIGS